MSKKNIVSKILENKAALGIRNTKQAGMIFDTFINILKEKLQQLEEGESLRLRNLGRFYTVYFKKRTFRNRKGRVFILPARMRVRFKDYGL